MNQLSDTADPKQPSFAERTGQSRRLRVTSWISMLGYLGGMIFLYVVPMFGWHLFDLALVVLIFFAIGFAGLIGKCLAVRCPQCRTFVVWHLFKTRGLTGFSNELNSVACPKCGYVPPGDNIAQNRLA